MSWPTMTDYQEAVENPSLCFSDLELRNGVPLLDRLGLPRPITGGFASVYQLACSGHKYAVRCFLRYYPDREERYAKISNYLKRVNLSCMTAFQFIAQGIKLRGQWYPILKMEWIDGDPLNLYVEKHLRNAQALQALAQKFLLLITDLQQHSIAHGDLQHANILVEKGKLRLIDYDAMYVPGLDGLQSLELGNRNYQHPSRTEADFGPGLDNFSASVIYFSLLALSTDPDLWRQAGGGEEHLLFRREDFEKPASSKVLHLLERSGKTDLQSLASVIQSISCLPAVSQIHPLTEVCHLYLSAATVRTAQSAQSGWLADFVTGDVTSGRAGAPANPPATESSWVQDHLQSVPEAYLASSFLAERVVVGTSLLLAAVIAVLSVALLPSLGLLAPLVGLLLIAGEAAVLTVGLAIRYGSFPEYKRKAALQGKARHLQREIERISSGLKRTNRELDKLNERERAEKAKIDAREGISIQDAGTEIIKIERDLQSTLAEIATKRQAVRDAEARDLQRALDDLQRQFISSQLARFTLYSAQISGIGPELKNRLLQIGARTAADITGISIRQSTWNSYSREEVLIQIRGRREIQVPWLGAQKARALLAWRQAIEAAVKAQAPKSISPVAAAWIRAKCQARLEALNVRQRYAENRARKGREAARSKRNLKLNASEQQLKVLREKFASQRKVLSAQATSTEAKLAEKQRTLTEVRSQLGAYRRVSIGTYLARILYLH